MNKLLGFLVAIIAIIIAYAIFVLPFTGWHFVTGSGDHTGYITAVERTGVFFKTGTAYLKTSTQSTQEDAYCVISPDVYSQLQADSVSGVHVNIHYYSWLSAGVTNCSGEDAIIQSVQTLQ